MAADLEVIVGTYEQFLLGYKVHNVGSTYSFEKSFATHSHLASIRAVASRKHYLASAGADDAIFLYDMRYRVESGRLTHHTDTINCIDFTPEGSHIMTAGNDGSIGIVRCGNWQLEKHWKTPHKGSPVNALAIHPTGKLAMSVGGDGVLRTWNLVKGRQAYATNLVPRLKLDAKNVAVLRWSPEGDKYLLVSNTKVDVYAVETAGLCSELSFESRVVCVEFVRNNVLAIGHEDGKVRFYDMTADSEIFEVEAHDARVKCLAYQNNYLLSASSSGEIKLWHYNKNKLKYLSRTSCGARITCMAIAESCPDLTTKKVEPKVEEQQEVRDARKNVFRMRQEVTIEEENDEEVTTKTARKKGKSGKKREADVSLDIEDVSSKKIKKKKKKTAVTNEESSSIKKRSISSDEKPIESPPKKTKRETTKIAPKNQEKTENGESKDKDAVSIVKKKKNKKQKVVTIEKPSKPVLKKRKQQNNPSKNAGLSVKTKKKKLSQ